MMLTRGEAAVVLVDGIETAFLRNEKLVVEAGVVGQVHARREELEVEAGNGNSTEAKLC